MSSIADYDPETGVPRERESFENPPDPYMPNMAASYNDYLDKREYAETWEHWAARRAADRRRAAEAAAKEADDFADALDQVAADFTSGYIDQAEAVRRLMDAGASSSGAEEHVARWALRQADQ